jgi:uncharacterized protein
VANQQNTSTRGKSQAPGGKQSGSASAQGRKDDANSSGKKSEGSTRGGTPEQHTEAGRQSHKNDK